jgi:ribosomal protein S18 acetylase RimI-like enzyme
MKILSFVFFNLCFLFSLSAMTSSEALLQGCIDVCRSQATYSPIKEHYFYEDDQRVIYATGVNIGYCNGVFEKNAFNLLDEKLVQEMLEFFDAKKLPFSWWALSKTKPENKFLQSHDPCIGIVLDLNKTELTHLAPTPNVKIKVVQSEQELADFSKIRQIVQQYGPFISEQFHAIDTALFHQGIVSYFIAYVDEIPVSVLSLYMDTTAGIWRLCTLSDYRKNGIASALVKAAIIEAKNHHYSHVMALLDSRQLAKGLFEKLGFKVISDCSYFTPKQGSH